LGTASFFAGLEKTFFLLSLNPESIVTVNFLQVTCNSIGYLAINLFCLHVVLLKYEKKILALNIIIASFDLALYLIFPPSPVYSTYEMALPQNTMWSQLLLGTPIIGMIPILLFYYAFVMRKQSPPHSKRSFWLGMATILIFITLYVKLFFPIEYADFTRLLWIPAFLFWYISFTRFIEVDWPKKLRHLYLIKADSGVCIYEHPFISEDLMESQLVGGSISGITKLMQEITRSPQRLQLMDHGNIKILLEYGTDIIGVLIVEANFNILRKKLKMLVDQFEIRFRKSLENYTGLLDEFRASKELINEIFSYKELLDRSIFD